MREFARPYSPLTVHLAQNRWGRTDGLTEDVAGESPRDWRKCSRRSNAFCSCQDQVHLPRFGDACQWPERVQQRLLDLIAIQPLPEVAIAMRRSPGSIRSMLYRLGAGTRMGQDWFTKHTLAEALHIRAEEVQRWISLGWLKCRLVQTGKLQREIIDADDFSEFCKGHSREVVGRRLNIDRLNFVKDFVFPPSHAELLPVRESKKERAAYKEQMGKSPQSEIDDEQYDEGLATSA